MAISAPLPPLALIAGPTASGKSRLALALAQRAGGQIVNADSVQLYRDLEVLTARPGADDLRRAPHHLFGTHDGALACSAAQWADEAGKAIAAIRASGRLPILVGGSGLYLRTLLDGIAPVPPIDPAVRASVRARSVEQNRAELERLDPEGAALLGPRDSSRIARALEVVVSTGRPLAHWRAKRGGGIGAAVRLAPLILLPPRDWLYRRCDARFAAMLATGAVGEVEALLARRLDPALPVMRAIGVREIASFLAGESGFDDMLAAGRQATRNYAKRQFTWFRRQPPAEWPRFTAPLDEAGEQAALAMLLPALV